MLVIPIGMGMLALAYTIASKPNEANQMRLLAPGTVHPSVNVADPWYDIFEKRSSIRIVLGDSGSVMFGEPYVPFE